MKICKLKLLKAKDCKKSPEIKFAPSGDYVIVEGEYMSYPQYLRFYEPRSMMLVDEEKAESRFERAMKNKRVRKEYGQ